MKMLPRIFSGRHFVCTRWQLPNKGKPYAGKTMFAWAAPALVENSPKSSPGESAEKQAFRLRVRAVSRPSPPLPPEGKRPPCRRGVRPNAADCGFRQGGFPNSGLPVSRFSKGYGSGALASGLRQRHACAVLTWRGVSTAPQVQVHRAEQNAAPHRRWGRANTGFPPPKCPMERLADPLSPAPCDAPGTGGEAGCPLLEEGFFLHVKSDL